MRGEPGGLVPALRHLWWEREETAVRVDRRVVFGLVAWIAALGVGLASAGGALAGPFVYVTNFSQGNDVSQYDASSGELSRLSPFSVAAGSGPVAIGVTPDAKSVYVVNQGDNTVSQYAINQTTGTLSAEFPFTVATGPHPTAIAVSSDGKSAYVTNAPGGGGSGSISQYTIDSTTGQLSVKTPATIATGVGPIGIALSPDGRSAYVTNEKPFPDPATVSQYTISSTTGTLSAKTPATVTTGLVPDGIAVSGNSVYVSSYGFDAVYEYTINPTTGALSPKATITPDGATPGAIAVSPDGKSAYVVGTRLTQFTINPKTGALSRKTPSSVSDSGEMFVAVSPDGKSAYLTNALSDTVSQYTINPTTGTLSPKFPFTVVGGGDPWGVAIIPAPCPEIFLRCTVEFQGGGTTATISSNLVVAGTVGILVQRILGKRIVTVGRVPLGRHPVGRLRLRWNLSVNGQRLPPGHYLITLRALGASGQVIALTAPVKITIHPKKHGHR